MEMSKIKTINATIHAAMAKKKRINPGTRNSNIKNTNPRKNQMTAGFLNISIDFDINGEMIVNGFKDNQYIQGMDRI
jgi:hypothetical protein